ncbi:family 43 glycosylhydrolase [Actomonas aquatica]|uniref:Family 43 glycosylhydrolase n=1 Tax=Actomonas aquatica TaxID=2866162 RepID=A0ABZ1C426_9BACT|nr:glycoside hydrolase family 43 C-terminal domain-containing protein [Opitutus sp. WL0086]WRQ86003.1 family 43 glycosylhydrolase [Opitutus sp. WL0086]
MNRLCLLPLLACLGCAIVASAQDPTPAPTFTNVTVHDPSIMRAADGTFYIYGSHLASARSTDLMHWEQLSTSATVGNVLQPNPATEFSEVLTWAQTNTFWAPDTIRLADGRYYFYYNACRGDSPLSAMGLAISAAPDGPFAHDSVLLYSGMAGTSEDGTPYNAAVHPNVVDPTVFFDAADRLWMVYGSYSGGIFIMELDPTTGRPLPDQGYGQHLIGRNHSRIEGAYILYSPESDYYYMFLSYGGLAADGGYNIRVARSRAPDGPYLDANGTDLSTVGGPNGSFFDDAAIAPHGVKLMGNYQFSTAPGESGGSQGYVSPGHNSAYYDPATGRYFLVFHTRFVGRGEIHEVRVHQMWLNADDWPVVGPQRYAGETLTATDAGRIVGDYKLINHGKDISATVKTSSLITLQPDGTIIGAESGTWSLSAENAATLTLGASTYRGVFARQWDQDRSRWLLTFSALNADGTAVWGNKVAVDTAPQWLTAPADQAVSTGATVTLTAMASGDPEPTYQWRKDGAPIAGATRATLTLNDVAVTDSGDYTVVATSRAGSATSAAATVLVTVPPIRITTHPVSLTQTAGSNAQLSVIAEADGALTYQWFRNDVAVAGATAATLDLNPLQPSDAGDYTVAVTSGSGTVSSRLARITVATPQPGRLANASVRSVAGLGGNPLIIGMVVDGGSKDVLIRAVGPTLASEYGVGGTLPDPEFKLYAAAGGEPIAANDNWGDNGQAATLAALFGSLGAFPLPDTSSGDAALVADASGPFTVHVNNEPAGSSGVVIVEAYDATETTSPRLLNISARNFAGTGDETLIAGFVIDGNTPKRLLIRGVGPTLAAPPFNLGGVLADPVLEIHTRINDVDTVVATNDDWADEAGVIAASQASGAFALVDGSADAAIVVTLPAGSYTAHVAGANGSTGEAIVEVYELP